MHRRSLIPDVQDHLPLVDFADSSLIQMLIAALILEGDQYFQDLCFLLPSCISPKLSVRQLVDACCLTSIVDSTITMKGTPRLLQVPYPSRPCPSHHNLYRFQSLRRPTATNKRALNPPILNPGTRHASTAAGDAVSLVTRLKNFMFGTSIILSGVFIYYYITDARAGVHRWIVVPGLRYFYEDAEDAHHIANQTLKALYQFGIHPRERGNPDSAGDLRIEVKSSSLFHILSNASIPRYSGKLFIIPLRHPRASTNMPTSPTLSSQWGPQSSRLEDALHYLSLAIPPQEYSASRPKTQS
jgi:hypothetical protein